MQPLRPLNKHCQESTQQWRSKVCLLDVYWIISDDILPYLIIESNLIFDNLIKLNPSLLHDVRIYSMCGRVALLSSIILSSLSEVSPHLIL